MEGLGSSRGRWEWISAPTFTRVLCPQALHHLVTQCCHSFHWDKKKKEKEKGWSRAGHRGPL